MMTSPGSLSKKDSLHSLYNSFLNLADRSQRKSSPLEEHEHATRRFMLLLVEELSHKRRLEASARCQSARCAISFFSKPPRTEEHTKAVATTKYRAATEAIVSCQTTLTRTAGREAVTGNQQCSPHRRDQKDFAWSVNHRNPSEATGNRDIRASPPTQSM